ncbi:MAG: hypothetical protein SFY66_18500 [Oculatellaceae cyanobacterium bins.114]|nr:hypothetical protein [Oculatellaceae cyanobacterium bins.114]
MQCFYVPGSTHIIDTIDADTGLSFIEGESLEQICQRYPDAEIWDFDEAFQEIERITYENTITPPVEVTYERWDEMINIMPPMRWRSGSGGESFMICEATTLDLHTIFCRIGSRYFELTNRRTTPHEEIVSLCREAMRGIDAAKDNTLTDD